jgi:hypothetical protein
MLDQLAKSNVQCIPIRENGRWYTPPLEWMVPKGVSRLQDPDETQVPSWLRMQLGDCPVIMMGIGRKLTDADRRAVAAFPEAEVYGIP